MRRPPQAGVRVRYDASCPKSSSGSKQWDYNVDGVAHYGFPYFQLGMPPVGAPFTPFSVAHVLEHCTEQGLGSVVNPSASAARLGVLVRMKVSVRPGVISAAVLYPTPL